MPVLKEKAKDNLYSAKLLKENNKLSSSIHCYYYTCLQTSKHILSNFCSISYENQQDQVRILRCDSHEYIINTLFDKINDNSRFKALDYRRDIKRLKMFRVKADYDNERINPDIVEQSELLCRNILEVFKNQFEINYDS